MIALILIVSIILLVMFNLNLKIAVLTEQYQSTIRSLNSTLLCLKMVHENFIFFCGPLSQKLKNYSIVFVIFFHVVTSCFVVLCQYLCYSFNVISLVKPYIKFFFTTALSPFICSASLFLIYVGSCLPFPVYFNFWLIFCIYYFPAIKRKFLQ